MTDDECAIRSLIMTWLEATSRGELDAVLPLMADDVVFLPHGRPPMCGRDAFAAASRAMAAIGQRIEARGDIREVSVAGNLAYCWNNMAITITSPFGDPVHLAGPALTVLSKGKDGHWLVIRDANMVAPITPAG